MPTDPSRARDHMVKSQLAARDVRAQNVLEAMARIPREEFLPPELAEQAYADGPLPIGLEQTISQPYVVALMAQALQLKPTDRVLEVGAGSGYAAAVLGRLVREVHTVERLRTLAEQARRHLEDYPNVHVHCADGAQGWALAAPYDAITVAAGADRVPRALLQQLVIGGRLIMPVGSRQDQSLLRIVRQPDGFRTEVLHRVRFVPLINEAGWREGDLRWQDLVSGC